MVEVARIYRFRAVHSLPDFPEPWCFPHEHDYRVEVVAVGNTPTDELDRIWTELRLGSPLDSMFEPSTVEHIAEELLRVFGERVVAVTVWEDDARWGRAS